MICDNVKLAHFLKIAGKFIFLFFILPPPPTSLFLHHTEFKVFKGNVEKSISW